MGNTNLPQSGAAHEKNGRDTRSGIEQLSDAAQLKVRRGRDALPTPSHSERTPDEASHGRDDRTDSPPDRA